MTSLFRNCVASRGWTYLNKSPCVFINQRICYSLWQGSHNQPRRTFLKLDGKSEINASMNRPITYQADVTLVNLNDITKHAENPDTDTEGWGYQFFYNVNIVKAMTAVSDQPWWTARDEDGAVQGYVLASKLGDSYGRISGLYVRPRARREGIGDKLLEKAMHSLSDGFPQRSISASVSGNSNAWKVCLRHFPQPHSEKIQICLGEPVWDRSAAIDPRSIDMKDFYLTRLTRGHLFDKVVAWDAAYIHEIPRGAFLRVYMDPDLVITYVAVDKNTEEILGYACLQRAYRTFCFIVGPLYADNDIIARMLFQELMNHYEPSKLLLYSHYTGNKQANKITDQIGLHPLITAKNYYTLHAHPARYQQKVYMLCSSGLTFH